MMKSSSRCVFRDILLQFFMEEMDRGLGSLYGQNEGLDRRLYISFFSAGAVAVVEAYFLDKLSITREAAGEQVTRLLSRNQ